MPYYSLYTILCKKLIFLFHMIYVLFIINIMSEFINALHKIINQCHSYNYNQFYINELFKFGPFLSYKSSEPNISADWLKHNNKYIGNLINDSDYCLFKPYLNNMVYIYERYNVILYDESYYKRTDLNDEYDQSIRIWLLKSYDNQDNYILLVITCFKKDVYRATLLNFSDIYETIDYIIGLECLSGLKMVQMLHNISYILLDDKFIDNFKLHTSFYKSNGQYLLKKPMSGEIIDSKIFTATIRTNLVVNNKKKNKKRNIVPFYSNYYSDVDTDKDSDNDSVKTLSLNSSADSVDSSSNSFDKNKLVDSMELIDFKSSKFDR